MKALAAAAALAAAGCASPLDVRLEPLKLVGTQDTELGPAVVVELASAPALKELRGYQVRLRYNVDGRGPVRLGHYTVDPYRIEDRLPFAAFRLRAAEGNRWAVPLAAREDRAGTLFAYDLGEPGEHELSFQLHGFQPFGSDAWTSNATSLRLPR